MQLRGYQEDAIDAIRKAWANGLSRPAIVLPTGAGKTHVFSALCSRLVREERRRPLILVNREELAFQTMERLAHVDPGLSIGLIKAEKNQLRCDVAVGSVQTLGRQARLDKIDPNRFDVIIADECHFSTAPSWVRIMEHFGCYDDPETHSVGVTATLFRMPGPGKQLGEVWEKVVFARDTRWAIEQGFLTPVRAETVVLPGLDLKNVHSRGGDFIESELGKALAQAEAGPKVAQAYLERARDASGELRRGIMFCPDVATATSFTDSFNAAGIPTQLVIGDTPTAQRQQTYAETRAGINKVISSVGVLTFGFDLPAVEVCVMARPTKSRGLYVQAAGRVLRPSPGKTEALILDIVGASRFGLISIIDLDVEDVKPKKEKDEEEEEELPGIAFTPDLLDIPDDFEWMEISQFDVKPIAPPPPPPPPPKPPKPPRPKAWRLTFGGKPYLPETSSSECVFLFQEVDKSWTVGELPTRGRAKRLKAGLDFRQAVNFAEGFHSSKGIRGRQLEGSASEAQLGMLRMNHMPITPGITKQAASDAISDIIISRRLDG